VANANFILLPAVYEGSPSSTSLPALDNFSLLLLFWWLVLVSSCGFNVYFLDKEVKVFNSMFTDQLYIFLLLI
jgi:hypothetical protein